MTAKADESALVEALRSGDRQAFAELVDKHTPSLLRVARGFVGSDAVAEEVVQETWIALVKGIGKFEERSSVQTWLFAVMANIAKARGIRERRDSDVPPAAFPDSPEGSVLGQELRSVAQHELDKLPERQRAVVTLRDMLEFDSAEVCELLEISVANQRVLLHRGRAAIRQALEDYVGRSVR